MRAAAFLSATIIVIGIYLSLAAAFGLSAAWIAIGLLTIGSCAAITLVTVESRREATIG